MSDDWLNNLYTGSKLGAKYSFSDKDTSEEGLINSLLGFTNSYILNAEVSQVASETYSTNILYNRTLVSETASYSLQVYNADTYQSISSPTQIPKGLEGWYDASNTASLIVSGSNLIGWNDLSTTSSHLDTVQGSAPQLTARTINGKTAVEFNNDGAIYRNINVAGTTVPSLTIGVVFSIDSAQGTIVSSRTTLDSRVSINSSLNFVMQAGAANSQTSTRTLSTNTVYRAIAVYDGVNSKLWIDGISEPMSSIVEDRLLLAMIGANGSGGTDYFDGLVGEVVVYESALTDSEAVSLDKYFISKWTSPTVVAEAAPYLLAQSEINLTVARKLTCDSANYSVQTFEVGNLLSRRLIVNESSFSIVYQEVSVIKISAIKIEAATQSYSVVPSEVGLFRGLAIPVTAQAFTLTGPPVSTLANRILTSDAVTYTRTFNDAFITKSSVILATTKTYQVSSFPITTPRTYGLLCSQLTISINLVPASILKESVILAQVKNFDLIEQANQLKIARVLFVDTTDFDLIGYSILSDQPLGYIKIWTGSQWENKPIKVWTGSEWSQKPLRVWNGTIWQIL